MVDQLPNDIISYQEFNVPESNRTYSIQIEQQTVEIINSKK